MRFFISLITFLCLGFNATAQGHDPGAADFIKDVYTKMLSSNPSKAKRYFKRRCRTKIKRMSAERHCELLTGCLGITSSDIDSLKIIDEGNQWYLLSYTSDYGGATEMEHEVRLRLQKSRKFKIADIDEDDGYDFSLNDTNTERIVDTLPTFPGGKERLGMYLQESLHLPAYARMNRIGGVVLVRFVIRKDGKVCNPTIVRAPAPCLENAVISLIRKMPKWNPAIKDGKVVNMEMELPIRFGSPVINNRNHKDPTSVSHKASTELGGEGGKLDRTHAVRIAD